MRLDKRDKLVFEIKKEERARSVEKLQAKGEEGIIVLELPFTVDQMEIVSKALRKMKKEEGLDFFNWKSKCVEYLCADYLSGSKPKKEDE